MREPTNPVPFLAGRAGRKDAELQRLRCVPGRQLGHKPAGHGARRAVLACHPQHADGLEVHRDRHGPQLRYDHRLLAGRHGGFSARQLDRRRPVGHPDPQDEGVRVVIPPLPQPPARTLDHSRDDRRIGPPGPFRRRLSGGRCIRGGDRCRHPRLVVGPVATRLRRAAPALRQRVRQHQQRAERDEREGGHLVGDDEQDPTDGQRGQGLKPWKRKRLLFHRP